MALKKTGAKHTPLHLAAEKGDVEEVRRLLQAEKISVNCVNHLNQSPAHYASFGGHADVIALLSEFNADLAIKDFDGNTPLLLAAKYGHYSLMFSLMNNYQCSVTDVDSEGQTIADLVFRNGNFDLAQTLIIDYNAITIISNNADSCGKTILHYACERGSTELVRTLILHHNADILSLDKNNCTPLDLAVANCQKEVVFCLVKEFNYDTNRKDACNKTLLHYAYKWGHHDLIKIVIHQRFAVNRLENTTCTLAEWTVYQDTVKTLLLISDSTKHDNLNIDNAYACKCSDIELVQTLITDHNATIVATFNDKKYDWNTPTGADSCGKTLLHYACEWGNIKLIRILILQCNANICAVDKNSFTPIDWAILNCNEEVIEILVNEFNCDVNRADYNGKTLLYHICEWGSIGLIKSTVIEHGADIAKTRHAELGWPNFSRELAHGKTLLHYACEWGYYELAKNLITVCNVNVDILISKKFDWSNNCDNHGKTLLHYACEWGIIDLIRILILNYNADIDSLNSDQCVWRNPNAVDSNGKTLLHYACEWGNIELIRILRNKYNADLDSLDSCNHIPLFWAISKGNAEVVLLFIKEFCYNPNKIDHRGRNLLHYACAWCKTDLVSTLISDYCTDAERPDERNNRPLHVAAYFGKEDIVKSLIQVFECDPNSVGFFKYTPLHFASLMGHDKTVHLLLHSTQCICETDYNGNTPLHLASGADNLQCVKLLLEANAPLLMRNSEGNTAYDVAVGESRNYLSRYQKKHNRQIATKYKTILEKAKEEYSGSHYITRILVLGNTGAGKSTLIKSLKREGFFQSFRRVSGSSIPPHSAGIIPSVYNSRQYDRTLFFDFAGDLEYYSSHAAILERIATSRKGSNICIIVVDLREKETALKSILHSWFLFIQYQKFIDLSFIIVGSHLDSINEVDGRANSIVLSQFCAAIINRNGHRAEYFMLDCRSPRSNQIVQLRDQISTWICKSQKFDISIEASLLLGLLLGDDFKEVTACSVQKIESHIMDSGVWNPATAVLHQAILELHEVGVLLVFGDQTKKCFHTILKISKLTSEVHKLLFSKAAQSKLKMKYADLNVGILPEDVLQQILPPHITNDCLVHLEYCQRINCHDIGAFLSSRRACFNDYFFLFFPALCSVDKSEVPWENSTDKSFSVGWLALCTDPYVYDYFPPRFLHVLLLRLVDRFTLHPPASPRVQDDSYHPLLDQSTNLPNTSHQQQEITQTPPIRNSPSINLDLHTSNDSNQQASVGQRVPPISPITPNLSVHHLGSPSALPTTTGEQDSTSCEYSRRCTMWKKGVHWKMEEGVDCMVELANENKGVVVFTKSYEDAKEDCINIFTKVVSCVMEAKVEFCHSIKPHFFLIDSSNEADYLNKDHQFAVSDVERALNAPKGKQVIVSVSGLKGEIALSRLQHLNRLTQWNSIFVINFSAVLEVLQDIVQQLYELGDSLGASRGVMEGIEADFPNNVSKRRRELVRWWMNSSQNTPCWWHLVQALHRIHENSLAHKIREEHGHHIQLQEKLLGKATQTQKPDEGFLRTFSGVVGSKWPSLAVSLVLREEEIEELTGKVGFTQEELALQMLKLWALRKEATYGQLCLKLKAISLFQYSY